MRLKMHDGTLKLLTDVRWVPDVKRNLVSLGTLELKGFSFSSKDGRMEVRKEGQIKMVAERRYSLYYLKANVLVGEANLVAAPGLNLWHLRLGHPAVGSIKELVKKGRIQCDDDQNMQPCENCLLGKAKKLPFPAGKHNSESPLDYAHPDLWGLLH